MRKDLTRVERKALGSDISYIEQVDTTNFVRFEKGRESYEKEYKEKYQMTAAKARRIQVEEEREPSSCVATAKAVSLGVVGMQEDFHVD